MAQRTNSFIDLRIGMYLIDLDRSWCGWSFLDNNSKIKNPSEVEACCRPLDHLDVIPVPEGGRTTRNVRHAVREDFDVEAVLGQVAA